MSAPIVAVAGPPAEQTPIDIIEHCLKERSWPYDRSETEISTTIETPLADYTLCVTWMPEICLLHAACSFDLKAPSHSIGEVDKLIREINGTIWFGHFDRYAQDSIVLFRCSAPFTDSMPTPSQGMYLVDMAIDAVNQHYRAFQWVVWAGKPAADALSLARFETQGNA